MMPGLPPPPPYLVESSNMSSESHTRRRFMDQELIFEQLGRLPRVLVILICLGGVAGVALCDYWTEQEASLFIFYTVPISIAAWILGMRYASAVSLLSVAAWAATDFYIIRKGAAWTLPYWNSCVLLVFFVVFALLIARVRHTMYREKAMSRTDPLTGVCNTRCFYERAEMELERSRRYGRPFSLAYLDVDDFKRVNDALGHSTGDALLRSLGGAALAHVRESDIVARLGGDEFCVLFPEAGREAARSATDKLIRETRAAFPQECAGLCSFSVGLMTFLEPPPSVEEAVRLVDALMYTVKESTKNAVAHAVWPKTSNPGSSLDVDVDVNVKA